MFVSTVFISLRNHCWAYAANFVEKWGVVFWIESKSGSTSAFCLTNGEKKPILEAEKGALIVFTLPEKMSCANGAAHFLFSIRKTPPWDFLHDLLLFGAEVPLEYYS